MTRRDDDLALLQAYLAALRRRGAPDATIADAEVLIARVIAGSISIWLNRALILAETQQ